MTHEWREVLRALGFVDDRTGGMTCDLGGLRFVARPDRPYAVVLTHVEDGHEVRQSLPWDVDVQTVGRVLRHALATVHRLDVSA